MSQKPKYTPEPRGWTQVQVAARLGVSMSWFSEKKIELQRAGMPQPDPITGRTDGDAVNAWMDQRSPLLADKGKSAPQSTIAQDRVRERMRGTTHA